MSGLTCVQEWAGPARTHSFVFHRASFDAVAPGRWGAAVIGEATALAEARKSTCPYSGLATGQCVCGLWSTLELVVLWWLCSTMGVARAIIANNIRMMRNALGMTQVDLSVAADIDRSYIRGVERDIRSILADKVEHLAIGNTH